MSPYAYYCTYPIYSITLVGFRCRNHVPNILFAGYIQRRAIGDHSCGYYFSEVLWTK